MQWECISFYQVSLPVIFLSIFYGGSTFASISFLYIIVLQSTGFSLVSYTYYSLLGILKSVVARPWKCTQYRSHCGNFPITLPNIKQGRLLSIKQGRFPNMCWYFLLNPIIAKPGCCTRVLWNPAREICPAHCRASSRVDSISQYVPIFSLNPIIAKPGCYMRVLWNLAREIKPYIRY